MHHRCLDRRTFGTEQPTTPRLLLPNRPPPLQMYGSRSSSSPPNRWPASPTLQLQNHPLPPLSGVRLEVLQQPAKQVARIAAAEDKGVLELLQEYAQLYGMSPGGQEAAAQALQVEGQE